MGREARIKAQKLQLRDWYEQQVFEKGMAKEMTKNADEIFTTQNDLAANNLLEVEKAEAAMRAELEHSRQEYNQFMESSKQVQKLERRSLPRLRSWRTLRTSSPRTSSTKARPSRATARSCSRSTRGSRRAVTRWIR